MKPLASALIILPCLCLGQVPVDPQEILDQLADQLLVTAEEDLSYEEIYETLSHLLANPVDLNTVTREQLRAIMLLSEVEINALLEYRATRGHFLDVLELQAIPGWTVATVKRLQPFVNVSDPNAKVGAALLRRISRETNQYAVMRYERTIESKPGYLGSADSSHRYAGNADRYYFRYRVVRRNDFSIGLTAEKDPGEQIQWAPSTGFYGFDFYSGHIQLMKKGRLENFIAGDFQCQFGQGLQLGSAFGLGKTAQTITGTRRSNLGFLPYVSANESYYMRGLAATLRASESFRVHLLGSFKHADAMVGNGAFEISSIQTTGLHRTSREIASRSTVTDRDLGLVIQFRRKSIDAGLITHRKDLSHRLNSEATPYNQFRFLGNSYTNVGAYFNLSWSSVTLFTEYARTLGHGQSLVAGVMGNLTHKLEMAWLFRDLSPNYYSSYANVFSESSTPQNERGLYWGTRYSFSRRLVLHGYFDVFQFPWLRYRIYHPSFGNEWLLRIDYSPNRSINLFVQFREEVKVRNLPQDGNLYPAGSGTRNNLWISGEFTVAPGLELRARLQGSQYMLDGTSSRGIAMVQEATWKPGKLSVSIRYAIFDTDDYENRQYLYEKDVWLSTSMPAFDGSGIRSYLLAHYALSKRIDFWFRWSRTVYADRDIIGTGMEQIAGNARNDIKFQVRIRP